MAREVPSEQAAAPETSATPRPAGGPAPRRAPRLTFLGGTSRSRASVELRGVDRDVVDREPAPDGGPPPPAGCPCSSGF
jgi:hypothetical protein